MVLVQKAYIVTEVDVVLARVSVGDTAVYITVGDREKAKLFPEQARALSDALRMAASACESDE